MARISSIVFFYIRYLTLENLNLSSDTLKDKESEIIDEGELKQ